MASLLHRFVETPAEELALPPPADLVRDELEHARLAVRIAFLGWTIGVLIMNSMPLLVMHEVRPNALTAILQSSRYVNELWWSFLAGSALLVLKTATAVVVPRCRMRRLFMAMGSLGAVLCGGCWGLVASLSFYLDYGTLPWIYIAFGLNSAAFGVTVAMALNHEELRALRQQERKQRNGPK